MRLQKICFRSEHLSAHAMYASLTFLGVPVTFVFFFCPQAKAKIPLTAQKQVCKMYDIAYISYSTGIRRKK